MGWRRVLTEAVTAAVRSALRTATDESRSPATRSRAGISRAGSSGTRRRSSDRSPSRTRPATSRPEPGARGGRRPHPDQVDGPVTITYAPDPDGQADPGEVVWAWVPYEEDASQGKDRPVLVVAEHGGRLVCLMLTSRDRDRDGEKAREAAAGRYWMDIGTGDWDRQRRPSEVRLDRVLRLRPDEVRREGGRLPRARFDEVAQALRQMHGWS